MPTTRSRESREENIVPTAPTTSRRNRNQADDKNKQANPHEALAPGSQEANEGCVVCMPAASVEVDEERMGNFKARCILAVERLWQDTDVAGGCAGV